MASDRRLPCEASIGNIDSRAEAPGVAVRGAARYLCVTPMQAPAARPDARLFGAALAAAVAAAIATAWLLPPPAAPRLARLVEPPRAADRAVDQAIDTLDRAVAARPNDPAALRRLAEQLRAAHRPLQLAEVLERLHGLTGEPEPLREAMELRAELGDFTAARRALERLAMIGAATEAEIIRLAALRQEAGDDAGAVAALMRALETAPSGELALRIVQAAARLPDPVPAMRQFAARLAELQPELLEPLRRMLMAEARPDLALALMEGLPPIELSSPATIFRMAEAEARAGFPGAALARLLALRATAGLPPGGGALLIDLALREGRLEEAFDVAAQLPAESWPAELPLRLYEAARQAREPELFRPIDQRRLQSRPEMAALVALGCGNRTRAAHFARKALEQPPDTAAGARGVALVLRELGQEQAAWRQLQQRLERARPDSSAALLFAELSILADRATAALPVLARLRAQAPGVGAAWLRLALHAGRHEEAAAFLRDGGLVPAMTLTEALTLAAERRDSALADAVVAALRPRTDLPEGWTTEEVMVTAALARPLTTHTLSTALDLLAWTAEVAARRRMVTLLAAAPELAAAAAPLQAAGHPAIPRLRREAASAQGQDGAARLTLLAVLAPHDALPLLVSRVEADPARFGAALALARLRSEGPAAAEATARALLPRLPRTEQALLLLQLLAAMPAEAQPAMAELAERELGPGWREAQQGALARQGRARN